MKNQYVFGISAVWMCFAAGCSGSMDEPTRSHSEGLVAPAEEGTTAPECAAVSCPVDHDCVVLDGQAECVPYENPCHLVDCMPGASCELIDGEAVCLAPANEGPEAGEENPCNLVDCMPGDICEVVDGEAVCVAPAGVPVEGETQMCGGIAGLECPGAGTCVDDATDDCDPEAGGADCSGVCECDGSLVLCAPNTFFDPTPSVCACVEEPVTDPCAAVRCAEGTVCVVEEGAAACVDEAALCAAVTCPVGSDCEVIDGEAQCVDPDAAACAAVTCPVGSDCEVIDGEAQCVDPDAAACAAVTCLRGSTCEVVDGEAQCVRNAHRPWRRHPRWWRSHWGQRRGH